MTMKQLSVFVENKPGTLAEITGILGENSIDMRALSVADTERYGILRLIVDHPKEAEAALKEAGFKVSLTDVIAIAVSNQPGGLSQALRYLAKAGIAVEYMYAFVSQKADTAYVILRVQDNAKAVKALEEGGIPIVRGEEVYRK
ncbi:MAG: ACT domain-containing protein [Oscillospiraceae bacterium]|nr:ACT domain-containing protein [Oscillospiraceae bacterium]